MAPRDGDTGLGHAPRPGEPESNLIDGMAAPTPPVPQDDTPIPIGRYGHLQLHSMPDTSGPGPTAIQEPTSWDYDFDPATNIARATFNGTVVSGGGGGGGSVLTVNNAAALTNFPGIPGVQVNTLGFATPGDTGGGTWEFFTGDTTTADGWLVVQPSFGLPGRWKRQVTGAVKPQWAGAGIGAADDSAQFLKVLNNYLGAAIDASGATLKIKNLVVGPGNLCPGIFSDGTGTLTGPAGVTFADNGVTVTKLTPFFFRRLTVIMAVSTNPVVPPAGQNRMIWFSNGDDTQDADGWEVTDCRSTGGQSAVIMAGRVANVRIERNFVTGTFGDGIGAPGVGNSAWITDNTIIDSCYATGAPQPAGAIRIGSSTSAHPGRNVTIARNHIVRCSVPADQSAIDCFSDALYDLNVHDNIIEDCGGGIELKTVPSPGGAEIDIYGTFNVCNNMLRMLAKANSPGITIFHAAGNDAEAKCGRLLIHGNHLTMKTRALVGQGALGISVAGYVDVMITDNFIKDLNTAISLAGSGVASNTLYRTYISGNTIDVVTVGIGAASAGTFVNQLYIVGNPMIKAQTSTALSFSAGTLNDVYVIGNYIWGVNGSALDLRGINRGLFKDNTITGGTITVVFQGTVCNGVTFENNRIATTYDTIPAVSGTVTNPGAGLTDGTRFFTVTNGTGTSPTIFSCVVAGGTITGPVVIVQPGMYSVFPGVPVVTVDVGVVGGATFTLTGAVASFPFSVGNASTNLLMRDNTIDIPINSRTIFTGSTAVTANNHRGVAALDPTATFAGSVGDVVQASNPTLGPTMWTCTVQGGVGAATWVPDRPTSQFVAPVAQVGNVAITPVSTYVNGPNTGAIGGAGQVWNIRATVLVGLGAGGPDFCQPRIFNGSAAVGVSTLIFTVAAGANVAASIEATVTLAAATTFTLQVQDVTTNTANLLAGSWISAMRVS